MAEDGFAGPIASGRAFEIAEKGDEKLGTWPLGVQIEKEAEDIQTTTFRTWQDTTVISTMVKSKAL